VTALPTPAVGDVWGAQLNAAILELVAARATRPVRASTGPVTLTPFAGGTSGTWTLYPLALRVTVPAAVGDVLVLYPAVIADSVSGAAEGDAASVVAGGPSRFYSSGTTSQLANGHGALYQDGDFGVGQFPAITWLVAAADLDGANVTLSLMYRATTGRAFGHAVYPSTVDLVNFGPGG
jgi:hypothetical protein